MTHQLTTEQLLAQLEERAQDARSLIEARLILRGISTVLGDLSNCPGLPPRNQGVADSASDLALHATIIRLSDVAGDAA